MGLFHSRTIYTSRPKSVRVNLESALMFAIDWECKANSVKELVDPSPDQLIESHLTSGRSIELLADEGKKEVREVIESIQVSLSTQGLTDKARMKLLEKRRRSSLSTAGLGLQASDIFASVAIERLQEQKTQQQQQQMHQEDQPDWLDSDDEEFEMGEENSGRSFRSQPELPQLQQQQQQQPQQQGQQELQPSPRQSLQVQPDQKHDQDDQSHSIPSSVSIPLSSPSSSSFSSSKSGVVSDLSIEQKLVESAVYCYRVKMRTNTMEAAQKKKKNRTNAMSIEMMKAQEEIDAENRILKDALANHDRAKVTIEWMKHDYNLCVAMFKALRQLKNTTLARNFVSKQQTAGSHLFHQLATSPSNLPLTASHSSIASESGPPAPLSSSTASPSIPTPAPPLAQLDHLLWELNEYVSQIHTAIRAHEQTAITLGLHYLDRKESGELTPRDVDNLPAQYWLLMDPKRRHRVRPDQLHKSIEAEGKKLQEVQRKINWLEEENVKISVAGHTGTGENQAKIYRNHHEIQSLQVAANQHSDNLTHLNRFFLSAFVKHVFHHLSLSLIPAASAAASQLTIESLMAELKGVENCTTKDPVALTPEDAAQIEAKEEVEQQRRQSSAGSRASSRQSGACRQSIPANKNKAQTVNSEFNTRGGSGIGVVNQAGQHGATGTGMIAEPVDGASLGVTIGTGASTGTSDERSPAVRRSTSTPYYMQSRQVDDSDQRFPDRDRPPSVNQPSASHQQSAPPSLSHSQEQSQPLKAGSGLMEKDETGRQSRNSKTNGTIEEEQWRGESGETSSRRNPPISPRSISRSWSREQDINETNSLPFSKTPTGTKDSQSHSQGQIVPNPSADNTIHPSPLPAPDSENTADKVQSVRSLLPRQIDDVADQQSQSDTSWFQKKEDINSVVSSKREIEGVRFHDDF